AADLLAEADRLWPATPAQTTRLRDWTERAGALLERRPQHAEARAQLATRTDLDDDPRRNEAAREWLLTQLDRLLASLNEVERVHPSIETRLQFASTLHERSVESFASDWAAAAQRVRSDARFAGFELAPQVGLVPLGPDPRSRLEEFAHLASGELPSRDATGQLAIDGESAIVLVLVPGGEFVLGSLLPDAEHAAGSPNVDPWTGKWDGPLVRVRLEPCLLGKFELTRGQVRRHAGLDPSTLVPDEEALRADMERLPVETISWEFATRWLAELDLALPTEAQWEHAARAGTTSVFFSGDAVASLQGFANVADATAARSGANWPAELALDDGFVSVAPVGSLAPNAFGLHDMLGNVAEWCRDSWEELGGARPRAGDGLFEGSEETRVLRGGSFSHSPRSCRSSSRNGAMPSYVAPVWGARAARRVER
ncbi:MAG: SUMF1/EgtB/PvdO family nonheme iron enzyme, partial [Planctomycetaceae bacterium]|nr:SUMF1/EgtB/PvdO family nonheme iron enzyme [Planctomycetaceae bacterium]